MAIKTTLTGLRSPQHPCASGIQVEGYFIGNLSRASYLLLSNTSGYLPLAETNKTTNLILSTRCTLMNLKKLRGGRL